MSGRPDEALRLCEEAVALDPVGVVPSLLLVLAQAGKGRTEDAIRQVGGALALAPGVAMGHFLRAGLLLQVGRRAEAADNIEAFARIERAGDPAALRVLAESFPGDVPSPAAISAVRRMERESGPGLYYLAAFYDWAGSEPEAVRVVEDAVAERNPWMGFAAVFPNYDGLRDSPRFSEILAELGLPNGSPAYRQATGRP